MGLIGVQRERTGQEDGSRGELFLTEERLAEVELCCSGSGVELNSSAETGERLRKLTGGFEHDSEVGVEYGICGRESEGFTHAGKRGGMPTLLKAEKCLKEKRFRMMGGVHEKGGIALSGSVELTRGMECTGFGKRVRVGRHGGKGLWRTDCGLHGSSSSSSGCQARPSHRLRLACAHCGRNHRNGGAERWRTG